MKLVNDVVIASGEVVNELMWPPLVFGLVFFGGFVFLGLVTFSYRNVANRHRSKTSSSAHAPGHH
ncbi:hypothetical protein N9J37_00315 [Pontimonas sp.]|jgi:hypothetical protein|nr:hypothetical protein [Pontimonas sp.]MDA7814925.1 hypothetical protein [Pontimonas sp.]MDA9116741.1 hypothetical protein [Pontimonas sp.]